MTHLDDDRMIALASPQALPRETESAHFDVCGVCRERLLAERLLSSLLAATQPHGAPQGFADRARARFLRARMMVQVRAIAAAVGLAMVLSVPLLWYAILNIDACAVAAAELVAAVRAIGGALATVAAAFPSAGGLWLAAMCALAMAAAAVLGGLLWKTAPRGEWQLRPAK